MPDLIETVLNGPAAFPYRLAWVLLVVGTLVSLIRAQLSVTSGRPVSPLAVFSRSLVTAAVLGCYTYVAKIIWWSGAALANQMFNEAERLDLAKLLTSQIGLYINTFTPVGLAGGIFNGIGDSVLSLVGLLAAVAAVLSRMQLQTLQVCIYNVLFAVGPLLIAMDAFGLNTLRIWLTAALEVSSWSITSAVIQLTLHSTMLRYINDIRGHSLTFDSRWLDVLDQYVFLASLMLIVPIISARFFGFSALGELAAAQVHTFAGNIGAKAQSWTTGLSGSGSPQITNAQPAATPSSPIQTTRPGD